MEMSLHTKQMLSQAQRENVAFAKALVKLNEVAIELRTELHQVHPFPELDDAISKMEHEIAVNSALIKRIETVGR